MKELTKTDKVVIAAILVAPGVKVSPTPVGFEAVSLAGSAVFNRETEKYAVAYGPLGEGLIHTEIPATEPFYAAIKKLDDLFRPKWELQLQALHQFVTAME
jgi:hypothetical protein